MKLAMCRMDACKMQYKVTATTNLYSHMKEKHQITVPRKKDLDTPEEDDQGTPTIKKYFIQEESMEHYVTRLAIKLELSFLKLCSPEIIEMYKAKKYSNYPRWPTTVRQAILRCERSERKVMIEEVKQHKKDHMVGATSDEWTSIASKRYMNINIHGKAKDPNSDPIFWNLGLFRMLGSYPADKCADLFSKVLKDHGIDLARDISALTTDGAKVMIALGQYSLNRNSNELLNVHFTLFQGSCSLASISCATRMDYISL